MSFFKRIADLFRRGPSASSSDRYLNLYVLDHRCKEPISGQIDLLNELSVADEDDASYFARKVLHTSGANRCFGQAEVMAWFDQGKRLLRTEVTGGRLLDESEYAIELERFNAPPEEPSETERGQDAADEPGSGHGASNDGSHQDPAPGYADRSPAEQDASTAAVSASEEKSSSDSKPDKSAGASADSSKDNPS